MPCRHLLAFTALFVLVSFGTDANAQMRGESRDVPSPADQGRDRGQIGGSIERTKHDPAHTQERDRMREWAGTRGTGMSDMGRTKERMESYDHREGHDGKRGKTVRVPTKGHQYGGRRGRKGN